MSDPEQLPPYANCSWKGAPGYEPLAKVLWMAHQQAAVGKGADRHGNGLPFHEQPMFTIAQTLGSIDGLLFQAAKKAAESRRLETRERAVAELLGAINYLAGAALLVQDGILDRGRAK